MENFIITSIKRIILVDKNEYLAKKLIFPEPLYNNELIYHFSGHYITNFNEEILENKENSIRFLPKGEVQKYEVNVKERGECVDIFFETNVSISDKPLVFYPYNSTKLATLFKKIFTVWIAKDEGYYFEAISILYKILSEMQKTNYLPNKQYNFIEPAVNYIENHFLDEKISIDYLIGLCGISCSFLEKIFIKKFGLTPKKYIILLKMNYACELLKQGAFSITEIAEMCKFSDVYFFSRQFKNYMGITPSQYIKKYKSSELSN